MSEPEKTTMDEEQAKGGTRQEVTERLMARLRAGERPCAATAVWRFDPSKPD